MINPKYYNDIKNFPQQFVEGFNAAKHIKFDKSFNEVIVCGMGGSSLYVELLNNYLATFTSFRIRVVRGYDIPITSSESTLIIPASYSGNTEETISCLDQAITKNLSTVVISSGGRLNEIASQHSLQFVKLEGGIQPRLGTGYFIGALLQILYNIGIIDDKSEQITKYASGLITNLNEEYAKQIAQRIKAKVPIVYATENISSAARITKIKFNENVKTQAFYNEFPELNHNEMVGFSNLIMNPFFLIFKSNHTSVRNHKRIEIFMNLMKEKGCDGEIIELKGENELEEILNAYYLADHITYFLADAYGVDPEPVDMVEDFKKMLD